MLIGKQFSIWEKKNATSSSICQIQYFAESIHINTPTIYLPISKNHRKNHTEDLQGRRRNFFNWRECDKYPLTHTSPIEQQLTSQVLKHPPSTTNRPYLEHSIVCIQLFFSWETSKSSIFFSASLLDASQIEFSMHAINEAYLCSVGSLFLPRESQRGRTMSWLTTTTIIQLCSPCKSHRGFIP